MKNFLSANICLTFFRGVMVVMIVTTSFVYLADHSPGSTEVRTDRIPVFFEENRGQFSDEIRFRANLNRAQLLLEDNRFELRPKARDEEASSLRMTLHGASRGTRAEGRAPLETRINYFKGNDPRHWHTGIPAFAKVHYSNVYPGIDMVFYGGRASLEYDFIVSPGVDPGMISLEIDGRLSIDGDGDLLIETADRQWRQKKPVVYQDIGGSRRAVAGEYAVSGDGLVSFRIGGYDRTRPLVIDPVLVYSTYLGGSMADTAEAMTVDYLGNVFIAGATNSSDFPVTSNAPQKTIASPSDVIVAKLNPEGTALVFATYLGGSGQDVARGIALDMSGNIYVAGDITSRDFPVKNAYQPNYSGGVSDGFITKLSPDGGSIIHSTYFGGGGEEYLNGVIADFEGGVHVTGTTDSPNFPTFNAIYSSYRGGYTDAFVARFNPAGDGLVFSTYLGGTGNDNGSSVMVGPGRAIFVSGVTSSPDFPIIAGAYQSTLKGNIDVFVTKIKPDGSGLLYSTYVGGSAADIARGMDIDASGQIYVTGHTSSRDFPTAVPVQSSFAGGNFDAFVFKLNQSATSLIYSTFLGGGEEADKGDDDASAIAIDQTGAAYITGTTYSNTFPATEAPTNPPAPGYHTYVVKLQSAGIPMTYSIYLRGGSYDSGNAIAVDSSGNAYVAGNTYSNNFPTTSLAYQKTLRGNSDAFITKLGPDNRGAMATFSAASYSTPIAQDSIAVIFGNGMATATLNAPDGAPLPATLGGTSLTLNGKPAPLFYVSPTQINFLVPAGTNTGSASMILHNRNAVIGADTLQIARVAPGLFSADSSGKGLAAALIFRVRKDGTSGYETTEHWDPALNKFVSEPIDLGPSTDIVYLVLFGTGLRYAGSLAAVQATIAGLDSQVVYCGVQSDYFGLDQANVRIPRELAGRGNVQVTLSVEGKPANPLTVNIK